MRRYMTKTNTWILRSDTFIRPRQKHKQHSSTIYKKYEKRKNFVYTIVCCVILRSNGSI